MSSLPQTPLFYVGIYLLIGLCYAIGGWKGTVQRVHTLLRERFGAMADLVLVGPVLFWPILAIASMLKYLGVVWLCRYFGIIRPTTWIIMVKSPTCKCGGQYSTQSILIHHANVIGKLVVRCEKCKKTAELSGQVEIDDPEKRA
jgi:hypothetical protein